MKFGIPIALLLSALLAACASPEVQKTEAPPQPQAAVEAPAPAPEPTPMVPELSGALRAQLAESGAEMAELADGAVRLTLPGSIAFASGSRSVSEAAQPTLVRIANALVENPGWRLQIEGHTDSVGRELFNEELSLRRAESVLNYLAELGVDPDRLAAVGRGEHVPVADNATAKGRAANRRIEIVVSPAQH